MTSIQDALAGLDEELARVNHPIHQYREPPMTLDQIESLTADSHLDLPADVQALWLWQSSTSGPWNQARLAAPSFAALPGGMELWTLEHALKINAMYDYEGMDELGITRYSLPAFGVEAVRCCWLDCSRGYNDPVKTVSADFRDPQSGLTTFASVVDLIEEMTVMLATGFWIRGSNHTGAEKWQPNPDMPRETHTWF